MSFRWFAAGDRKFVREDGEGTPGQPEFHATIELLRAHIGGLGVEQGGGASIGLCRPQPGDQQPPANSPVSYTHLRAHETVLDLVCRLLLEKKKKKTQHQEHTYLLS